MWWRTPWLKQRGLMAVLALADAALLVLVYNLIFWLRFHHWAGITGSIAAVVVVWLGCSYLLGRYSGIDLSQTHSRLRRVLSTAGVVALVLVVVVVLVQWMLQSQDPRTFRNFILPALGFTGLGSGLGQLWFHRRRPKARRWLLVGSEAELQAIQQDIERLGLHRQLAIECRSVETLLQPERSMGEGAAAIAISEMAELPDQQVEHLLSLRAQGTRLCTLVTWSELYLQRVPPELLSNRWLVQAEGFQLQPGRWSWRLKRFGDLLGATLLLAAALPLLLMAAAAIWIEDRGPVLYQQERTGLYGQTFTVWKLRSMRREAESAGARWASRQDARITRVGTWLRRLRLDELPQLLCVLKGEMSLIGPRPERPEIEAMLEQQIAHYRIRHWIRPGLSGWAQVCHPYGASIDDSRSKLSYDVYYLRNAGWMLDLLIVLKTIRMVALAQGAIPRCGGSEATSHG